MKIQTAKIGVLALFNQEILYLNNNKPFLLIFSGSRMNSRESPDPTGDTFETMSIPPPGVPRVAGVARLLPLIASRSDDSRVNRCARV